ncbi:lysylphosphatidylglycerol synthase transmembrane domain-containing protein [Inediibacterium massiliense]|uniref:lysylphosphatidylglycerol synthase transmembrane domain-containing protein n=1 Tax=Inediibacterium massiliense TaxID=1658111 RepID=UPI0006B49965|nr:lysylphosphatidylglycerol synthase transmembrane domain-containing protein [Inediibacterium massiliense]
MKKRIIQYGILIFLLLITLWIVLSNENLSTFPKLLFQTNPYILIIGFIGMIGYWVLDALIIKEISKMLFVKNNFLKSIKLTFIGQYYSLITPFASGGQPAQIYSMIKDSVPLGKATSILIEKFIIYQVIVTIYSIFMFIIKLGFVYEHIKASLAFIWIGIFLNFIGLLIIFILFLNGNFLRRVIQWIMKTFIPSKIKQYEFKIERTIKEYEESVRKIRENKKTTFKLCVMTILQLTFYFSITYWIYRSLGLSSISCLDVIAIQSLLYMAVSFIPTPGTVGSSEGGFYLLFQIFFGTQKVTYAMLLWRMIVYYFNLLVCGIATLIDYMMNKKMKVREARKETNL